MTEIVSVGGSCVIGEFEVGPGCLIEEEGLVGQDCEDDFGLCLPPSAWPDEYCNMSLTQKLYVCDELVQTVTLDFEVVVDNTGGEKQCAVSEPPRVPHPPLLPPSCEPSSRTQQLNVDARKRPQESEVDVTDAGLEPAEVTSFSIPIGTEYGDSLYLYRFAFIPDGWSYTVSDSNWINTPDTVWVEITHDDVMAEEDTARIVFYAYTPEEDFAGCAAVMVYDPGPPLSVEQVPEAGLPRTYELAQNYPNPFNPITNIEFALPRASDVIVEVVNILGQRVAVLVDERLSAGRYRLTWDGTDRTGKPVASGVYLYHLRAGDFIETRKMMLLK
jgi:hypothetical protein